MKTSTIFLILVLTMPVVNAYSFGDFAVDTQEFISGYISMTGAVISKITTKVSDLGSEDFKEIHPSHLQTEYDSKLCRDTDDIDYSKKGECISHEEKVKDYCSPDGEMVMEFYCGTHNKCKGEWYICENRCVNGFCV
jgi:hypothetical protein